MSTYYMDNASTGSQYYFNANNAASSQSSRTYSSSEYPSNRMNNTYQFPQQYQSVAGFNRNTTQQRYQTPQSPAPQVRATVRVVGSQEQYNLPSTSQPIQISPQQHHFQFDSHHRPGYPTGPAVVYQTPGAAQFTHRNVDLWTEGSSQGQDHHVQAQRVSVRSVSTGSPQQSHSVSPQLQQYYSQLTPEQHQQLLRQQQLQRQQEQKSFYEQQQQRVTAQQISPSTQQRGGQSSPQGRARSESERQRQDEQDYYAAQRQMATQKFQQQQQNEQPSHPVGIRNLMTKFTGPGSAQPPSQSRSRATTTRHYSTSSYTTSSGPNQSTSRSLNSHSMTYSALPKAHEPPVNSLEYYQMLQQAGNPFTNIQQAVAPAHIQHSPTGLGGLRDRFKTGSFSEDYHRSPPQQQGNPGGNTLSSLRNQYANRAKESSQNELPPQPVQNISRTIVGEDVPRQKPTSQAPPPQQQPPATVLQAPEKNQPTNENPDQQASSPPTADANDAAEGVSSF